MKYRKAVLVVAVCILLAAACWAAYAYLSSRRISREEAASVFQRISLPAGLRLQSKAWFHTTDPSLPEEDTWQYTYVTSQSAAAMTSQLAASMQNAGLTPGLVRPDYCTATTLARQTEPDSCPQPRGAPLTIITGSKGRYAVSITWSRPVGMNVNQVVIDWDYF